jgi:uncharacterized protein YndB with AHSA1/START domain
MEIKHQFHINASPKTIFNAITTQAGINGWWAGNAKVNTELEQDSVLIFVKETQTVEMVLKAKEKKDSEKFTWLCTTNGNPVWINTILSFEITKSGTGSELNFTHTNFEDKWKDHPAYQMTIDGWKHFMSSLKDFCETGKGQPWG